MKLSQIIFGCVSIATLFRRKQADELIKYILKRGIISFDTAPLYSLGYSEKLIGELLYGIPKTLITTKFGGLGYPNPNPKLPLKVVMPLNALRRKYLSNKKIPQSDKQKKIVNFVKRLEELISKINIDLAKAR